MDASPPEWLQAARSKWTNRGTTRPPFADTPGHGQESVWDYPRPPAIRPDGRQIVVGAAADPVATTIDAVRVLETSHPPSFYLPPDSIGDGRLVVTDGASHCEWKGAAEYVALAGTTARIGWRYPDPYPEFAEYAGWCSFYPDRIPCTVDGETVRAQVGGFYGGWITDEIVGPFKGQPGTADW